jgi:hypothetical protein
MVATQTMMREPILVAAWGEHNISHKLTIDLAESKETPDF